MVTHETAANLLPWRDDEVTAIEEPDWLVEVRLAATAAAEDRHEAALEDTERASGAPVATDYLDPDLDAFLDTDEEPFNWLVPNLLEHGDRVIVTGQEGTGKSTLLRQTAVQLASGRHPFTGEQMPPLRVLFVDCENSERQARRAFRPLRDLAGPDYAPDHLRLRVIGQALDVARPEVYADLATRLHRQAVDVLIIGPLYKLLDDDPTREMPARAVADALDRLRAERGSAVIVEAHSPYAESAKSKRPIRPYGASLWSRWPEFGIHLADDGKVEHWRGQRDQRAWPARLDRAAAWPVDAPTAWPWTAGAEVEPETWDGPTRCMADLLAYLQDIAPSEVTRSNVGKQMRLAGKQSYKDQTLAEALEQLAAAGRLEVRTGPRNGRYYRAGLALDLDVEEP